MCDYLGSLILEFCPYLYEGLCRTAQNLRMGKNDEIMDKKLNLYGKEIASYKIDYLGGHKSIESSLLNAKLSILEKGIMISSLLQNDFVYLKWSEIESIAYGKSYEQIEIDYEEEKISNFKKHV